MSDTFAEYEATGKIGHDKDVVSSGLLSEDELITELHNAGLGAWHNYDKMGKSGHEWHMFRSRIAKELIRILEIRKRR